MQGVSSISKTGPLERLASLAPRERLTVAGAVVAAICLFLALLTGEGDLEPVELARPAASAPSAPAVLSQMPPQPAAPASANALVLRSILAGAAVIADPGGEKVVRIGRDVAPGLALKEVGVSHAIVGGIGPDVRLELGKSGGAAMAPASPAAPGVSSDAAARQRAETLDFRLGLESVASGGRAVGYSVRPGARLPHLTKAGLQTGDVILGVNGSRFDEERMMELSWEIENSPRIDFDVLRGGRRMNISMKK